MPKNVKLVESIDCGYFVQDVECFASIQIQNSGEPMLVLDRPIDNMAGHIFAMYVNTENDARIQLVKGSEIKDFSWFDIVEILEKQGLKTS